MIIVTGLGRCGTSFLMLFLRTMGFGLGQNISWNLEMNAGYELSTAYTLTDDLYKLYIKQNKKINLDDACSGSYWKGFTYRQAIQSIDKDHRQGDVQIIKDPRLTWHREIIRAWWEARQDLILLILHRETEDIYKSRARLPIQYQDPKEERMKDPTIYKIDFCEFLTEVMKNDIPFELLMFPNFLNQPQEVFEKLERVGLEFDTKMGHQVWSDLVNPALISTGENHEAP